MKVPDVETPVVHEVPLAPEAPAALSKGTERLLRTLMCMTITLDNPYDEDIATYAKRLVGQ